MAALLIPSVLQAASRFSFPLSPAVDAITNHVIKLTGNDDALHADYGDKGGHRLRHDDAERAQQLLRDLQEDVVITYCDKHADQFVLMCTKLYAIHAWKHIDGASGTYRKIDDEDEKTVVARLADIVQDLVARMATLHFIKVRGFSY